MLNYCGNKLREIYTIGHYLGETINVMIHPKLYLKLYILYYFILYIRVTLNVKQILLSYIIVKNFC